MFERAASRSPLKKHEEWLLGLVKQEPDLTLEEIQRRLLDERQQKAGIGSVWRFLDRHGINFKKSVRATEQDRPDVAAARTAWADSQPKLDPDRLVFIDETGTSTNMARLRGRAPRGERLVGKIPHGHWKTGAVFRFAIATGRAERDPTADLRSALITPTVTHRATIVEPQAVAALLRAIEGFEGHAVTRYALKLAPLDFVRPD